MVELLSRRHSPVRPQLSAGTEVGSLSGTGFLLLGDRECGPVVYEITLTREGRYTFGRGWIDAAGTLLRRAYQAYRFQLVLSDGTKVSAGITRMESHGARFELLEPE